MLISMFVRAGEIDRAGWKMAVLRTEIFAQALVKHNSHTSPDRFIKVHPFSLLTFAFCIKKVPVRAGGSEKLKVKSQKWLGRLTARVGRWQCCVQMFSRKLLSSTTLTLHPTVPLKCILFHF